MVFPVVMYGCESWSIKKAESQRNVFQLSCWRRLLRVPWTARRSNPYILKESVLNIHWKDCCWSWSFNTLAICMSRQRADSLEKTQMLGKIEGGRRRRQDEMVGWHHRLNGHEFEYALGVGDGQGSLVCYTARGHKESDMAERLNRTELKRYSKLTIKKINKKGTLTRH